MIHRIQKLLGLVAVLAVLSACGPRSHLTVHFASASAPELAAVEDKAEVWYHFKPGDTIPLHVLIIGVAEGGAKNIKFTAKKEFYIVVRKGMPTQLSFDGQNIAYRDAGQTILGLGQVDGKNALTIIGYVGKREDMPAELKEQK